MIMMLLALATAFADSYGPSEAIAQTPIVKAEFVFERAPFPSAHASTIVETKDGLVAAWFGGTRERNPDVGIWVSRYDGKQWSAPVEVANGVQPDGTRHPCWNPVLFQPMNGTALVLFYKVGPSPSEWWGMVRISKDAGRTWSEAAKLPPGILGPIRAKPIEIRPAVVLAGSSTENDGWIVHMERYAPVPRPGMLWEDPWALEALASASNWEKSAPLNTAAEFGAIQPTILVHSATELQILCRTRQGVIAEAWSHDQGKTWSKLTATTLPNPSAGIDAVSLTGGGFLLVYNPSPKDRLQLQIARSSDGKSWQPFVTLENETTGEYSYPAMIQTRDGLVHVTYTWRRERIRHVVVQPDR
jgi:predicted neuraminidase